MPETHINAYYADLITAKQEAAVANQKVVELEDQIKAKGGEVPSDTITTEASQEDTASSEDVSAAEVKPKKGKK